MGSRRGRHAALAAALAGCALAGCTVGAPPGFSEGDRWVIPLIGPLEDGLLLVPALVNDKGPYVFAIDPDAHVSIIDRQVVDEAQPRTGEGPRMLDESDTQQNRFYAEILAWQLGTLTVKGPKPAQVVGKGTFDADGRRIHGVIGRDIIADSLVFGFDRDQGVITLTTQKAFKPPAGASSFTYSKLDSQIQNAQTLPLPRRLVTATVGGQTFPMHVDLGATTSQLRPRSWVKARLEATDAQLATVDEVGMLRKVRQKGVADAVTVADATTQHVVFVPYGDRRWPDQYIEGSIGLGFFKPYDVIVNWDQDKLYIEPRNDARRTWLPRISRWQSKTLTGCEHVGCVKLSIVDPLANKPAEEQPEKHPGIVMSIVRDASAKQMNLEVLVAVTPSDENSSLKWLVANLPAGTDRAMTHLPAEYIGARFTVLDASPFPRSCPADGACIDRIEPPQRLREPSLTSKGQVVPPTVLEGFRTAGSKMIVPDGDTKLAILQNNAQRVVGHFEVCIDTSGAIANVEVLESTGFPAYDNRIVGTIKRTWRYQPYVLDGKPVSVCTNVTVIYSRK